MSSIRKSKKEFKKNFGQNKVTFLITFSENEYFGKCSLIRKGGKKYRSFNPKKSKNSLIRRWSIVEFQYK